MMRGRFRRKVRLPYFSDPMLEQYFSLPQQRTQYRRKNCKQQWSCEECKCPGSAYPIPLQIPTKFGLHPCERGRLRERRDELCGFQSVSRSLQHLQVWTIIPSVKNTRLIFRETNLVSSHHFSGVDIKADQIPSCHETEMFSKRIHPNIVLKLRISHGYMAGLAFCEAFARKVSEYRRGMDQNVLSMFLISRKFRNTYTREL